MIVRHPARWAAAPRWPTLVTMLWGSHYRPAHYVWPYPESMAMDQSPQMAPGSGTKSAGSTSRASARARIVRIRGTQVPVSMRAIVARPTPARCARSSWVHSRATRAARTRLATWLHAWIVESLIRE